MKLEGLSINFLGDSITEGVATNGPGYRFSDLLAGRFSLNARNYGERGTRIARQSDDSPTLEPVRNPRNFCARAGEMDPDADIVFIFGGVNDCSVGVPLGQPEDRMDLTFYGALHVLYSSLTARFPKAKIVVATPIHFLGEEDPVLAHGCPLSFFAEAIRQTAAEYGFPVLDLYATYGVLPGDPLMWEKYIADNCHPNDAGHVLLAQNIGDFLLKL